jgi:phage N-6-adenine-methyltransferase
MGRPKVYRSNAHRQRAYRSRVKRRARGILHGVDEWETPPQLFAKLHREFRFTLDVAALPHNAKCRRYFTPADDGLTRTWTGMCWMNPPYGPGIGEWVRKACESAQAGATVVCLLPASTDTAWWHDYVEPHAECRFIRGRVQFSGHRRGVPRFASVIAVFRPTGTMSARALTALPWLAALRRIPVRLVGCLDDG